MLKHQQFAFLLNVTDEVLEGVSLLIKNEEGKNSCLVALGG
jgi:hypothetical protein